MARRSNVEGEMTMVRRSGIEGAMARRSGVDEATTTTMKTVGVSENGVSAARSGKFVPGTTLSTARGTQAML